MSTPQDPNAPFFVDTEVIRLTRDGIWLSDGTEIDHEQTVRVFFQSVQHDAQGYCLRIGRETKRIEVEDTAWFVARIFGNPREGYVAELSDGKREPLVPETLTYRPGRLSCRIHGGADEAKFLHAPYIELLRNLEETDSEYFLRFAGKKVTLASK